MNPRDVLLLALLYRVSREGGIPGPQVLDNPAVAAWSLQWRDVTAWVEESGVAWVSRRTTGTTEDSLIDELRRAYGYGARAHSSDEGERVE